jgi:integrase
MTVRLTDTAITAAVKRAAESGAREELADAALPGLRLRVTPSGRRSWVLGMRDPLGRMRRFPLGHHPDIGIAAAREAARAMRATVRAGADPVEAARRKRAIGRDAREGIGTLSALIELYGTKRGAALKSWPDCKRRIKSVFARLLHKPVATMRPEDIQLEADCWASAQSAAAAVRYLRPILRWASDGARGYVSRDLALLSPPATVARRDRVLSRDELSRLLPALRASDGLYGHAIRFMLLTACRREEAGTALWHNIDLENAVWTIPVTKSGRPHVVALSAQALVLLRSVRKKDATPDALVFATKTGGRLANWDRVTKKLQTASGTKNWTRHDLRRTAATTMGEMGVQPHVIEAALNHSAIHSQLATNYNKSRYSREVAAALQLLADALDGFEKNGAVVVQPRNVSDN